MCGIAGMFGASDESALIRMLPTLRHRGPDDEFYVARDGCALGVRRLSIIDLAGGRQPIANETGDIWVAQNGEIYNFPGLMANLKAVGHRFRSRSDTEVIVHLYEEEGEQFVDSLNGMYATAIWDGKNRKGILARDRVGKKPLYYHLSKRGVLYFASEIKALLALPFLERRICKPALHHYLTYKHIPAPFSIFEGLQVVPPGHLLIYLEKDGKADITLKQYWRLDFGRDWTQGLSEAEIIDRLLRTLSQSVERRLVSDVPLGFFLSGGVDSSLCVAIAATISEQPIQTFTLGYGPESTTRAKEQDRQCAARIARQYGTKHCEEIIESSHLENDLYDIVRHFDEPFAGVVSAYFLARRISRHVKVAISGDGADELFGSYLSHRIAMPIQMYLKDPARWSNTTEVEHLNAQDKRLVEQIAADEDWRWHYQLGVFSDEEKRLLYSGELADQFTQTSTAEHSRLYFSDLTAKDPLNRVLEAEFNSQLPDQVLTYADRLSMAHSLEVRSPYLDTEFMELAAGIPGSFKSQSGQTKYILKKAACRFLPEGVVYRPKEGFLLPINQWLLQRMEPWVKRVLCRERLRYPGLFSPDYVEALVEDFYREGTHLANKVWVLMVFQIWYESYFEGSSD